MKAVVEIDLDSPQAKQLLSYIETLPFAKVKKGKTTKSKWDEAIAEGAITSKEFHTRLENEIQNNW